MIKFEYIDIKNLPDQKTDQLNFDVASLRKYIISAKPSFTVTCITSDEESFPEPNDFIKEYLSVLVMRRPQLYTNFIKMVEAADDAGFSYTDRHISGTNDQMTFIYRSDIAEESLPKFILEHAENMVLSDIERAYFLPNGYIPNSIAQHIVSLYIKTHEEIMIPINAYYKGYNAQK